MEHNRAFSNASGLWRIAPHHQLVNAELQLTSSLCDWVSKDNSILFKGLFREYIDVMERHIERMGKVFEKLKTPVFGLSSRIMSMHITAIAQKLAVCTDECTQEASLVKGMQAICAFKLRAYEMAALLASNVGLFCAMAFFDTAAANEKNMQARLCAWRDNQWELSPDFCLSPC